MKNIRPLLILVLLTGLAYIYFSDILFSDRIFVFRDLSRYYHPLRSFVFSELAAGRFPFWNPYLASGHPLFAALQSAVLYPVSIFYCIFNFDFAFNFFIVVHIILGGFFFYLLMADLKFSLISSLISAVVFMFSGYLIGVINLTTTLSAAVWFPLVFLFFNRAIIQKKFKYLVLSSIFLGCMFLGGEPTPLYATIFFCGLYSFIYVLKNKKERARVTVLFVLTNIIFLLLCSFQILPFFEFLRLSNRTALDFEGAMHWSFPPRDIINFFLPFFYGPSDIQEQAPFQQDWLLLVYLGVIPAMLFVFSWLFRKDEYSAVFKITFALSLLFIFGRFTPLYKIFYHFIPGLWLIRYPVKFFFLSAVSFAFLCGSGWEEYRKRMQQQDEKSINFIKAYFVLGFFAAILFLLLYLFKFQIHSYLVSFLDGAGFKNAYKKLQYIRIFSVDFFNFRRLLFFFIAGSLFLFLGAKRKVHLAVIGFALWALTFVDLYGSNNIEVNPAISKAAFHNQTMRIKFLKKDESLFRFYTSYQMNKANNILKGDTHEEALAESIDNLCSNRLIEYGLYDARGYFSMYNAGYLKVLNLVDTSPFPSSTNILNMLNVKYILTPREINDPRMKLVNKSSKTFLYENLDVLPRAYLVSHVRVLKTEIDIASALRSKEFDPAKAAVLEEEPHLSGKARGLNNPKQEYAHIVSYRPDKVAINVAVAGKPKLLVLADNYYPGWEAYVDGIKDKIYKTNFILRGVYLAPGAHSVIFSYNPLSFEIGLCISIITALILLLILLFGAQKEA